MGFSPRKERLPGREHISSYIANLKLRRRDPKFAKKNRKEAWKELRGEKTATEVTLEVSINSHNTTETESPGDRL